MSGALVKSVILAAIGLALQFILFLVKQGKARRLEEIKKKEEEEANERMRLMEEEWKAQAEEESKKQPEFVLTASNNQ
jgi:Flp pilus assembly protein TadB